MGCLVVTGTTGRTSCGTPERLRPSPTYNATATVYNAARSTSNFPKLCRVRAVTERGLVDTLAVKWYAVVRRLAAITRSRPYGRCSFDLR